MKLSLPLYVRLVFHILVFVGLSLVFLALVTYWYFAGSLQSKTAIMNSNDTGVVMVDRNNKPFFSFYEAKNRHFVPLSQISVNIQEAVIAAEDKEFYYHNGFSLRGFTRAVFINLTRKDVYAGGSTITQQLVKNALLSPTKSFFRKYEEVVLASEIERKYSKNEIMEMYLNSIYFGRGAFGVEEAALRYFDKHAKDLTLSEASFLAAIIPTPSIAKNSDRPTEKIRKRQAGVLKSMLELKLITSDEYNKALKTQLSFTHSDEEINTTGPHFALMVRDFLVEKYGEEQMIRSGFKVKTTLDVDWQRYAEKTVAQNVVALAGNRVTNGAAVVMDPKSREVRVLVGSADWYNDVFGKLNMATAPRQPGSSFKPIVYAAALENQTITPATVLKDNPTTFHENGPKSPEYKPQNYDGKWRGPVLVRRALANSLNVPAVEVLAKIGVEAAIDSSKALGITTIRERSNYGLSLVLGTAEIPLIEMTNAYAAFDDGGKNKNYVLVTEIIDKRGKKIYESKQSVSQVFSKETSFLISSILSDNRARAELFGNALTVNRPAAVKTGTTENYRDAWTIGYTPSLVVGVWVGNNDGAFMDNIAGSLGAAPIWRSLIEEFSKNTPIAEFAPQGDIVQLSICNFNGLLAEGATISALKEYFIEGTQPVRKCSFGTPIVGSSVSPTASQSPTPSASVSPTIVEVRGRNAIRGEEKDKRN